LNGPFSGKTNLDFTEARDSELQWHQLGRMQVCTSLQTDNHAGTQSLRFLQAGCPSCHPTNTVKALKEKSMEGKKQIGKLSKQANEPNQCQNQQKKIWAHYSPGAHIVQAYEAMQGIKHTSESE